MYASVRTRAYIPHHATVLKFHSVQQNISRPDPLQFDAEHYRKLYTCFSLFGVLYLPDPGLEDIPIGDELMEWLNTHFIEPSTQEGDELSSQERPWEDPAFWPYLTRSVSSHAHIALH